MVALDHFGESFSAFGDDMPLTFMEQTGDAYDYIYMGAGLYRRMT